MTSNQRILITRTDRMGDVLLALPCLQKIRKAQAEQADIDFLCDPSLWPLIQDYLDTLQINVVSRRDLQARNYDAVLYLFGDSDLRKQLSRIPIRVGAYSKPWSFFWFTHGWYQHRSEAKQNEAQYNLDLADHLLQILEKPMPATSLEKIILPEDTNATKVVEKILTEKSVSKPFSLVHPGMGGSALNLSAAKYSEVIQQLQTTHPGQVILSVGPSANDQAIANVLTKSHPDLTRIDDLTLAQLKELFRKAALVVAPSTGPLHLAHYVNTPTLGFFPPIRTQRKERWAPWGGAATAIALSPTAVDCPAVRDCIGTPCPHHACMEKVDWTYPAIR